MPERAIEHVHRRHLYLLGTDKNYGSLVIRRSDDGGKNWTEPKDRVSGLLYDNSRYHGAPVPVVVHRGRIWRGVEDAMGPGVWGSCFRARMLSAPEDSDLLKASSWTLSSPLAGDRRWLTGKFGGWLEGNDLIAVSRTAFDDAQGGAHNQHDANYLTFHRIVGFRSLKNGRL